MRVTYESSHLDIGQFVVRVSGTDNILILFGYANGNNGSITGGMCYFSWQMVAKTELLMILIVYIPVCLVEGRHIGTYKDVASVNTSHHVVQKLMGL